MTAPLKSTYLPTPTLETCSHSRATLRGKEPAAAAAARFLAQWPLAPRDVDSNPPLLLSSVLASGLLLFCCPPHHGANARGISGILASCGRLADGGNFPGGAPVGHCCRFDLGAHCALGASAQAGAKQDQSTTRDIILATLAAVSASDVAARKGRFQYLACWVPNCTRTALLVRKGKQAPPLLPAAAGDWRQSRIATSLR